MASIVGLEISVAIDSARIKRGLNDTQKGVDKWAKNTTKKVNNVARDFRGLATAVAGIGAAVGGFTLIVKNTAAMGKEVKNLATFAGVSSREMQRLGYAGEQVGISMEKMADILKDSKERWGEFKTLGTGAYKDVAEAFANAKSDFDLSSLIGKGTIEQIQMIYNEMDKLNFSDSQKSFLLEGLAGDATTLNTLLANNGALLQTYMNDANVLSNEAIEGLSGLDKLFRDIGYSIKNSFGQAVADNAETIQKLIEVVGRGVSVLANFAANNPTIVAAVAGISALTIGVGALAVAVNALTWPISLAAAAVAGLIAVVVNWESIVESSFGQAVIARVNAFKEAVTMVWDVFKQLNQAVGDLFTLDFSGFGANMKGAFLTLSTFFYEKFGAATVNLVMNLKDQFEWAFDAAATVFTNTIKAGLNIALKPIEYVINSISKLYNKIANSPVGEMFGMVGDLQEIQISFGEAAEIAPRPDWRNLTQVGEGSAVNTGLADQMARGSLTNNSSQDDENNNNNSFNWPDSGSGGGAGGKGDKPEKMATEFLDSFKSSFSELLKTGDFGAFATSVLDNITNTIIDSFSNSLIDGLTNSIFGEGFDFDSLFAGFGEKAGKGLSDALNGIDLQGIFKGFGDMLSSLFSGLGGLLGGGGGGGFLSFFGMAEGGVVPNKPTPFKALHSGTDTVPTLLTPGETVVPVGEDIGSLGGGSNQTFSISVTGDVSRQTRAEINKMIGDITAGVNRTNFINGHK